MNMRERMKASEQIDRAIYALRVSGHDPVRIYASDELVASLLDESGRMLVFTSISAPKRYRGIALTCGTLGGDSRVVAANGIAVPITAAKGE